MKKTRNKALGTSLVTLSILGTAVLISPIEAEGAVWGGNSKIIETQESNGLVMRYKFNPNYSDKDHANFYDGREMWREVYNPENPNLPGGFVWYSIVPQTGNFPLSKTDLGAMMENRQTIRGHGGDYLVSGAGLNLKYGSSNPWTGDYLGNNSGSKTIKSGTYKGKKYEYRFIGYNGSGSVVSNPYFPADDQSSALRAVSTKAEAGVYWSKRNWVYEGWKLPKSINTFGGGDDLNRYTQKVIWIKDYFFKDYPAFKDVARAKGYRTLDEQAGYWANYLRPLTDPSKETGVWLGWHYSSGVNWYVTMITTPPEQTNMRLVKYRIYDSQNRLVAEETRNGTSYEAVDSSFDKYLKYVYKGETYRIEVDVKNMPNVPQTIKNTNVTLEHMYNFDDNVGNHNNFSTPTYVDTANAPHQNQINPGEVAHFTYNYTVPMTAEPGKQVEFFAQVPDKFYDMGYNTVTADDEASIIMDVAPENLGVEFEGYYDLDRNLVDYVTPNYEMWVKYKVTKTAGTKPVNGADLKIKVSDNKFVTTNTTYNFEGTYDKNGRAISDGVLKKQGDYAIFWASITPRQPKLCTEASILSKWANRGVNNDPSDDVAKPNCLINPDNIVVSNVNAKPDTVFLSKTQSKKSVQYTVSYNLTNYNYDKKDKVIPVIYTIDGRVVDREEIPVESLKTMKITRILPAVNMGEGEHIIQVEANPQPRKYVEIKTNSQGKEVNPYTDNIGYDKVNVEKNPYDKFRCPVAHTANYWNTRFTIRDSYGWSWYHSTKHGGHRHYETDYNYSYPTVSFYEKQEIKNIFFRSKFTTDKKGGWVDLLNTKGTIKAGYGFELKVVTAYKTNTYNDTPKWWNDGWHYGWYARSVSPKYTAVDSSARLKVTMPFTDDAGQPIALVLDGRQTGSWYSTTTTYELESRTVINKPEKKVYINENTKDGNYNVRVETEPFYGSYDKPYTRTQLCDIKNVTIEVKGSYLDDVKTHVVQ